MKTVKKGLVSFCFYKLSAIYLLQISFKLQAITTWNTYENKLKECTWLITFTWGSDVFEARGGTLFMLSL